MDCLHQWDQHLDKTCPRCRLNCSQYEPNTPNPPEHCSQARTVNYHQYRICHEDTLWTSPGFELMTLWPPRIEVPFSVLPVKHFRFYWGLPYHCWVATGMMGGNASLVLLSDAHLMLLSCFSRAYLMLLLCFSLMLISYFSHASLMLLSCFSLMLLSRLHTTTENEPWPLYPSKYGYSKFLLLLMIMR